MSEGWKEFAPYLKELARGPDSLKDLDPTMTREATELVLRGVATPAQAAGFFLIGRAKGNGSGELAGIAEGMLSFVRPIEAPGDSPVVAVAGGFDGKLRTQNVGALSSIVAAAAGGKVVVLAGEDVPPKSGRTDLDALRNLGVRAPQTLQEARASLVEDGFAAVSPRRYLPELDALARSVRVAKSAVPEFDKMIAEARERLAEAREQVHRERAAELSRQSTGLDAERDELAGRLVEILDKQADLYHDMVNEVRQSGDGDEANRMFVSGNGTRDWLELVFARWLLR